MDEKIELSLTKREREICWHRVIQSIIEKLPSDYPYFDDVFELDHLANKIDQALRELPK